MKKREKVFCFLAVIAVLSFFILPDQNKPGETFESVVYLSKAQKLFLKANKHFLHEEYSLAIGHFNQALALIDEAELSLLMKTTPEKTKLQKNFDLLRDTINSFKKHTEKMLQRSTPSFAL